MSVRTDRMIGSVVPWEQEDPNVQAVLIASGLEYDRVEELMLLVREQAWPHRADDTYGLLAVHEAAAKLPVAPAGLSVPQRQARLQSLIQSRRDGRKGTWAKRLTLLLGTNTWTASQNFPLANHLTVFLNALPSSGLADAVLPAIERFTPCAWELHVTYQPSFIIGDSPIGDSEL